MTFSQGDTVSYKRLNPETLHLDLTFATVKEVSNQFATLSNGDIYPFFLLTHADPRPQQLHPHGNFRRRR